MIPAEAVEAAAKAHFERDGGRWDDWTQEDKAVEMEDMRAALEAAAPHIRAQALEYAAEAISSQRDSTNPNRSQEESWSVIDHRAGRFLGKTVAVRLLRARAATERREAE